MNTLLKAVATRFGYWGLVFAAVGSAMLAHQFTRLYYQAELSNLHRLHAQALADQRADDVETLRLAKQHGDELTGRLQKVESTLTKKQKELHDAIRTQTTGRACLSGSVVSLLNNSGSTDGSAHLPASTASPAAADGSAASDTAYASDRDIAEWAANARTQYDICRAKLNALIDW